ncbi:hypothetical protein IQ279_14260 [Streptomyces verrucosisporus]|uniref:DUF6229 family protein n=1 Tax=Streptomyces verrucosisporus TaxID=1695161 RepID=UPI0019D02578|nr:DUF6229 family protein [Streptomyces verrucosisporus]MBN3930785.1 hypothetical protein [Streptomyces verrucosisporus]
MPQATLTRADEIVAAWLDGAESSHGELSPAGPLYVGGDATEAALVDATDALFTACSSCSGSMNSYCC